VDERDPHEARWEGRHGGRPSLVRQVQPATLIRSSRDLLIAYGNPVS
jgi:hypothetical protein